jgi:hypothetical protein
VKLSSTFRKLSAQFREEFEEISREIEHRGASGEAREQALQELLRLYLPGRAGVGDGFVVDAHGGESKQVDVVIYDEAVASVFTVGGTQFFPCETVIAVGEVKSRVDSVDDLADALGKIRSVKRLDRSNRGTNRVVTGPGISLEGLAFDPSKNHRDQILGFVLTGGSLQQATLIAELQRWNAEHPRTEWPNIYCDYSSFIISYEGERGLTASTMDAQRMYCTSPEEAPDLLLLLVSVLSTFVNEAHVARPNYFDYGDIGSTVHTDYPLAQQRGPAGDSE